VPGPHFLNGMLDLIRGRINLGATRLIYAVPVVVAISVGLALDLTLLGVSLPVDPVARPLPLWHDVIAAGPAVAFFGVILTPVSRRSDMPFAANGFAPVISMMPDVFMFRTASGLAQLIHGLRTSELMDATVTGGSVAILIILGMGFGLIVPKLVIDYFGERVTETES